jgi:hypothetical protein
MADDQLYFEGVPLVFDHTFDVGKVEYAGPLISAHDPFRALEDVKRQMCRANENRLPSGICVGVGFLVKYAKYLGIVMTEEEAAAIAIKNGAVQDGDMFWLNETK